MKQTKMLDADARVKTRNSKQLISRDVARFR